MYEKYIGVAFEKSFEKLGCFVGVVHEVWRHGNGQYLARVVYTDGDVEDIAVTEVDKLRRGSVKELLKEQLQTSADDPVSFSSTSEEVKKVVYPVLRQSVLECKSVRQGEFAENKCNVVHREASD